MVCDMWYVVCGMWYAVCGMWYAVCGMWYVVCGMRYVVCGMWYVVCGMWYAVCGMRYVVCGMWYVVCGMWYEKNVVQWLLNVECGRKLKDTVANENEDTFTLILVDLFSQMMATQAKVLLLPLITVNIPGYDVQELC